MELTEAQLAEIARCIPDVKLRYEFLRFVGWIPDPKVKPAVASAPDPDVPRFCRDCRWMESEECQRVTMAPRPRCLHPSTRIWNLVTGAATHPYCLDSRVDSLLCGRSAKHFSPRDAQIWLL